MASALAEQMSDLDELSCVLIPTEGENLLLPNVCVAEIVPWRRIKTLNGGPSWCLGFTGWRGLSIPVIHYRGFDDEIPGTVEARCLVVMNRARTADAIPFYAFAAQSLPYMVQLAESDLQISQQDLHTADAMKVDVGSIIATIPDLAYVEERASQLHRHATGE